MLRISSLSIRSRLGGNHSNTQTQRLLSFKAFANRSSNAIKPTTESSSTTTTATPVKPNASSSSNNNVNNYNRHRNNVRSGGYHHGNNHHQGRGSAPSNYNANGQQFQQHTANNNNRSHRLRNNPVPSNNNNTNRGPQNNNRGPTNNNNSRQSSWQQNQRQQQDTRFKQQPSSQSNNSNNSAASSLHNFVSRNNNNREAAKSMSNIRQPTAASTTNVRQPTANTSNVRQSQPQQQRQPTAASSSSRPPLGGGGNMNKRVDNDIRDISQLRNTFIKSPQTQSNVRRRGTPLSSTVAAVNSNSLGGLQPLKGGQKSSNVDAVAASIGVGSKWTPSSYRKKVTPPLPPQPTPSSTNGTQSSSTQQVVSQEYSNTNNHRLSSSWKQPRSSTSTSAGAGLIPPMSKRAPIPQSILSPSNTNTSNTATTPGTQSAQPQQQQGIKSMEQVLKDNALQRKYNMEQTYINAGQRIPQDEAQQSNKPKAAADMIRDNKPNWRRAQPGINRRQSPGHGGRFDNNNNRGRYNQRGVGYNNNNNQQGRYNNNQYQNRTLRRKEQQRKQIRKHLPSSTPTSIKLPSSPLTLVDLSLLLRVRKRTLVRTIRSLGESIAYTTANQDSYKISIDMMELICIELGIESSLNEVEVSSVELAERRAMRISKSNETSSEEEKSEEEEKYALLPPRSPVVSIMGHVDHGKTTLMDMLRSRAVTNTNDNSKSKKGSKTTTNKSKKKKKSNKKSKDANNKSRGDKNGIDGNVAGTEAGGITQVITAFEVPLPLEESASEEGVVVDSQNISTVTFLDTPGHAAFKKMRQSGSSATDVIVLVVAADDGVSPQTIEIINMYKSIARLQPTSISLVVAVTKIDKPGIDIDESVMRIENQLIEHEIYTENVLSGGGDDGEFGSCQLFPVSGVTGEGVDDLIEGLALQAEIMDLRADEDANGEGIVIDARMEKGLGVVADCVIRWGCVNKGDFVVSGTNGGRVKFLNDVGNKPLKSKARPSQPVRIVGFKTLPKAGDPIVCANSEDEAKELIRLRESELSNEERAEFESDVELQITGTAAKNNMMMQNARNETGFDDLEGMGNSESTVRIPVVIKADSHGSLEAVRDALVSIGTDSKLDIIIDPVEMSTGVVTSSDVDMARISEAAIFAFGKVGTADKETKNLAETDGVSIRSHDIIYRLLEDAKEVFAKYLPVTIVEKIHGKGKVQAVFDVTDSKKQSVSIAGLRVTDGNLFKAKSSSGSDGQEPLSCFYRVLRNGKLLSEDVEKLSASSLRKVKEDVDSVRKGEECGLGLTGFNDLEEGDIVECYSLEEQIPDI